MFGYDLAIDLGSSNLVITVPNKGVVINEPSYVAYDEENEKIIYIGKKAYYLQGREPNGISVIQPIKNGAISRYTLAEEMLKYYIDKALKKSVFKPRIVASVPSFATDVEKRILISVFINAGAKSVCLIENTLCAALGCKVEPTQITGSFVIDIGGETTSMAIISQGSISQSETVKIGGDDFDREITRYVKEKYNMSIGIRTAEDIKKQIGGAVPRADELTMRIKGRSDETGLPIEIEVTSTDVYNCLSSLLNTLTSTAFNMFQNASPQLIQDITNTNVILTGGSANLYGIDKLFSTALDLDVEVYPSPELCVANGACVALCSMHKLESYGYAFKNKEDVRIR